MKIKSTPKRMLHFGSALFFLYVSTSYIVACRDDSLGERWVKSDLPDEAKYGPASPLIPDTEHWYTLITAYKRTAENDDSGLTQHEVQGMGHLCIKIDAVNDIHTEEFKDEPETIVTGRARISGIPGDENMFFSDQDNPHATGDEVDSLLGHLWLKSLVGKSVGHGYETPKNVNFRTQMGPVPSNFASGLSVLPFFEIRQLAKELNWSGWTSVGGELEGTRNLTNHILGYFQQEPFDLDFMASPSNFKTKITTPPANCAEFTDPTTCGMNDCTWASPLGATMNSCMPLLRIGFAWRESIAVGGAEEMDILHFIEFMYFPNGTLYKATEDIRPDSLPRDESLSASFPEATCSQDCQSADLSIKGGFNDDPAYPAPCGF